MSLDIQTLASRQNPLDNQSTNNIIIIVVVVVVVVVISISMIGLLQLKVEYYLIA